MTDDAVVRQASEQARHYANDPTPAETPQWRRLTDEEHQHASRYPLPVVPSVEEANRLLTPPYATPCVWQPIATAPIDGTWVLLGWFGLPGMNMRKVGSWHSAQHAWCDVHQVLHNRNSFPTHWSPLPDPPLALAAGTPAKTPHIAGRSLLAAAFGRVDL